MATYTVKQVSRCRGGEHFVAELYRDGVVIWKGLVTWTEMADKLDPVEPKQVVLWLMRHAVDTSKEISAEDCKTAIEAKEWRL